MKILNLSKKVLFLGIITFIGVISNVKAFTANVRCSSPSSVRVGESFTVTISGSSDKTTDWKAAGPINSSSNLRLTSGDTGSNIWLDDKSSFDKSYTFEALAEGTATINQSFTVTNQDDFSSPTYSSNTCNITIVSASSNTPSKSTSSSTKNNNKKNSSNKSSDTNLKSLEIEGITLNPEFNKDTLEYNVEVENNVEKININAKVNDNKSSVNGTGEKDLEEGLNSFEIIVTAENGATKTYTLKIIRKEKDPIKVTVDGKNYTVIRKEGILTPPEGFEKINLIIDDQEVIAFENKKINYVLVGLTDEDNNSSWYIYSNNKYEKYYEYTSNSKRIIIINSKKKIPHRYFKLSFNIGDNTVNGYALSLESDFRLVYAINIENGEESYYLYDLKENTFQRFYNDQVNIYVKLIKNVKIALIILSGLCLILFINLIIEKILYKKLKSSILKGVNKEREKIEEKDREKLDEEKLSHTREFKELDLTNEYDEDSKKDKIQNDSNEVEETEKTEEENDVNENEEIEKDKKTSKKIEKQKLKEEKKRMKEERKKFLDE